MDKKLISNVVWALTGQVGYILIGLAGTFVLARLLSPEDFGIVGIAMGFVGISNVLVESGMGGALVRKIDATDKDYSTIFVFNLFISLLLIILLVFSSGFIAQYYNRSVLQPVLWGLSSILLFNAFTITQNARLVKDMKFKERGLYKFLSLFFAVVVAVIVAYLGYGVWAVVFLQVLSSFFFLMILLIKEGGMDKFIFSKESFKEMYSFGMFTTFTSLLNSFFDNIYQFILGKYFSVAQVGFYYQAKKLQDAPDTVSKLVLLQVVYSHLSKLQNKLEKFKISYNMIAKFTAIILGLTASLTFIYAEEIIILLYGQKWLGSVFFLQILVIVSFFNLQEIVNRNIFKVFNQTHKIFYLEIIKKSIQSITIIVGIINHSLEILLYGFVLTSFISYFINFYYSRKIVDDISRKEIIVFIKIVFSSVILTFFVIYLIGILNLKLYETFILIPFFVLLYTLLLYLLRVENLFKVLQNKRLLK